MGRISATTQQMAPFGAIRSAAKSVATVVTRRAFQITAHIRHTVVAWSTRNSERNQLCRMSDRERWDIRVSRSDTQLEVNKRFWQM